MGEHTPLSEEWFNPPLRWRGHEIETRYSPQGETFAGCQCGWRSGRMTRRPLKSWVAHVRRATSNQDRTPDVPDPASRPAVPEGDHAAWHIAQAGQSARRAPSETADQLIRSA